MGELSIVVGAQFGSEGKGAIAGYLSRPDESQLRIACVRVAGPNAGHTVYDSLGRAHKLRQVPVGAVTNPDARLVIAAGSEIDPPVLANEIEELEVAGISVTNRLMIDRSATRIEPRHLRAEIDAGLTDRIGSTGKGVGAARADRIWRAAQTVEDLVPYYLGDTAEWLREWLRWGNRVLVEGTQGYGLGLHTKHYPKTTSSDCRAIDFLAMVGLSPWAPYIDKCEVWLVARTFPIRVAGNSGPLHRETSWAELGLPQEHTTVTNKVRRVGHWDPALVQAAVRANGGPSPDVNLALTMVDHRIPKLTDQTKVPEDCEGDLDLLIFELTNGLPVIDAQVELLGTGPASVIDLR